MTADTLALADFLLARFIDDIASARQVQAQAVTDGIAVDDPRFSALVLARRVLAECEAKRAIVQLASEERQTLGPWSVQQFMLAHLALPYADHPDYRQEWRP